MSVCTACERGECYLCSMATWCQCECDGSAVDSFDIEPQDEFIPGIDGCHHGLGFDEDCEDCNDEERIDNIEQRRLRREQRDPQGRLDIDTGDNNGR